VDKEGLTVCGNFFGGGGGGSQAADQAAAASQQAAEEARQREFQRQGRITDGTNRINQSFAGFGDDFYNGRKQAYLDYANPQLEDQYGKARNQIAYALSRNGLTDSSEAAREQGELRKQYDLSKQGIVDTGTQYANDARGKVEQNRSDLVSQLQASADPDTVARSAAERATGIQVSPAFSPLGNLFANLTGLFATTQNAAAANGQPRIGSILFGQNNGAGSSRVVT
jgi:hypothetical protein